MRRRGEEEGPDESAGWWWDMGVRAARVVQCEVKLDKYAKTHPFAGTQYADNIVAFNTERYVPQPLVVQGPGAGAAGTCVRAFRGCWSCDDRRKR